MVPLFQVECPKCNAKNKSGARYCGKCGGRLPGSEQKCGNCGAMVPADKAFCGNCGKPLSESASPLMTGNRWARRTVDFATKVEVDDVEGFFKRGLVVEAGTKAIFFANGAYSGILEPGRYDMGGLLQRIKNIFSYKTTTAVLVDTGDVELEFTMGGLTTRDPIRLAAQCRLVVQMENPTQFFENMMKGRQNYTLPEMQSFLEGEIQNCLGEFVGGKTVQELSTNVAFKQQMEQGVAQHLATTFNRKGLSFVQVRIFDFRHPRMDAVTNQKEEYWLHAQDLETKLAGEGSSMGLDRKLLDQETAKHLMELEVFEDRAKVFDRMRKAVASDDMNKVTTETELEKFLQGIDKDKMLRHEEMRVLVQDFGEKKEDHDLARAHLIQRLKIEQNTDVARATLAGQISLNKTISESERNEEMSQLDHELAARRKEMEMRQAQEWAEIKQKAETKRLDVETELDLERRRVQQEIDLGKQRTVMDIDLGKQRTETEIELDRKKKLSQIELDDLDDQKDLRTASASLDLLKKQKGIKKEEFDWELDRKLRERAGESEVTMREEALRHERELAKIQAISTLSTEALIAAAPADRAAMLADLKRTEGLKGFSEDQLLAMAADKSPEIAKAFQEKFKNASSTEIQKAYEKMLDMKDASTKDLKEMSRDYAKMMQEMYNRGMDTQRDTATAAARSGQPDLTVIATGTGQPGQIYPRPPNISPMATKPPDGAPTPGHPRVERVVLCPECHLETAEGAKFCENCGHKFFG